MRGWLTSYVNLFSSRPPPPMYSRQSAARPLICRLYSTHWSNRQLGCARPIWDILRARRGTIRFDTKRATAFRRPSRNTWTALPSKQDAGVQVVVHCLNAPRFTFPMPELIQTTSWLVPTSADFTPWLVCLSCGKERLSACWYWRGV